MSSPLPGPAEEDDDMMAWILVSLLASFAGDAVVDLSPETQVGPTQTIGGDPFPPKT